jgi:hypothetical protein
VTEHDRLFFPQVFVVDLRTVFRSDRSHEGSPYRL